VNFCKVKSGCVARAAFGLVMSHRLTSPLRRRPTPRKIQSAQLPGKRPGAGAAPCWPPDCSEGGPPMPPLSLSDVELGHIMAAFQPLAPDRRAAFMEDVAHALASCPAIGPGSVHRAIVTAQRAHFDPPMLDQHAATGRGKYC